MAWMPVAEAAARLGVSERTIWRRIKSESIPSRSEAGRTLVDLEESDASADGLHGAELHSRAADDDALAAVMAELAELREANAREFRYARRGKRAAMAPSMTR